MGIMEGLQDLSFVYWFSFSEKYRYMIIKGYCMLLKFNTCVFGNVCMLYLHEVGCVTMPSVIPK